MPWIPGLCWHTCSGGRALRSLCLACKVPSLTHKGQDAKARSFRQEVIHPHRPPSSPEAWSDLTGVSRWSYQSSLPPVETVTHDSFREGTCPISSVTLSYLHLEYTFCFMAWLFLIFSFLSRVLVTFFLPKIATFSKSHSQLCRLIVKLLYFNCTKLKRTCMAVPYLSLPTKSSLIYFYIHNCLSTTSHILNLHTFLSQFYTFFPLFFTLSSLY